jgi:hypothetical protein
VRRRIIIHDSSRLYDLLGEKEEGWKTDVHFVYSDVLILTIINDSKEQSLSPLDSLSSVRSQDMPIKSTPTSRPKSSHFHLGMQ